MIRYLLDTNVVSELRKPRPHGAVLAWIENLQEDQLFVSAVTIGELQIGVERVRRHDAAKAIEIEHWIDRIMSSHEILAMDATCLREWARIMEGRSTNLVEDAMIAATARVHRLTVATRNERDFRALGLTVLNPFEN